MINIKPVGRKILVKPGELKEEQLPSGIILPDSVMAKLRTGRVVATSDLIANLYPVGTVVLFNDGRGLGQPINGEYYLWLDTDINKDEIWGIELDPSDQ